MIEEFRKTDQNGSPRRERRRLEMRQRILQAALGLFREAGFESTTVTEICAAADIAYGTFFNHFPTKHDLLRTLVEEMQAGLALHVEELAKGAGSMSEKLGALFQLFAAEAEEFGPGHRELIAQVVTLGHQEAPADKDRGFHAIFHGFLESGVARGELRAEDLDALTEIVLGAYTSITLGWVHFDDYPLRERSEAVAALLSRILTRP